MQNGPFLDDFWRDILAVLGGLGVVFTAIGVWLAWRQMRQTTSAAKAASEAAINALNESRSQYNRFVITQISRHLAEARTHLKSDGYGVAAMRLSDIADLMLQIAGGDESWSEMAQRLQAMEQSFDRVHRSEVPFSRSLRGKWQKLDREVNAKIANSLTPFTDENEAC